MPNEGEGREQGADGLSWLQRVVEDCIALNGAFIEWRKGCLQVEHSSQNMGGILWDAKKAQQHVCIPGDTFIMQNRPYHLKNDKI